MNQKELQSLLQKRYNPENWQAILEDIFPSVSFLRSPENIEVNNENVKSFQQTGLVRLQDGKNLAVFEVILDEGINLLRNRVSLRNLTTGFIDEANTHGVLVIYDQGTSNYRFSFVAKESGFSESGELLKFETASKRYTYILGEGESCRTAAERFSLLAQKKLVANLDDVIDAFSVEQLSKEFFSKYKEHYQIFVDYLAESNFSVSIFNNEQKRIRDFVKKLIGRVVFLYFVQKKGWLGSSSTDYSDGDQNFMKNFWESSTKDESFYTVYLHRLFFDGINCKRDHDNFKLPNGQIVKVPFLNGGLYEKELAEPEFITFPPQLFDSLFNFLSSYNFTIDENDPDENEIGIDPEMLGHIFENLLEDNRDKGAYYTPKEVVKFMVQESLLEYLISGMRKKAGVLSDDETNALRYFIQFKLKGDEIEQNEIPDDLILFYKNQIKFLKNHGSLLDKLLDEVKICDPAIGSGAFPVGLLNEIYQCKILLNNTYTPSERARIKRHIIENSIYGVDIEKGAVDIARLRFWLSLIVDEQNPVNLPNLDYKIIVGDSLVGKFEDEVVDIDWSIDTTQYGMFNQNLAEEKLEIINRIVHYQNEFFNTTDLQKSVIKKKIKQLKVDLLIKQFELQVNSKGIRHVQDYKSKKEVLKQTELLLDTEGWTKSIEKLKKYRKDLDKEFIHFDWILDFPEILNPRIAKDNTGFDIIIGNPPYVSAVTMARSQEVKDLYRKLFPEATGSYDIYILFVLKALGLLKPNGVYSWIIPNKFLIADYAKNVLGKCIQTGLKYSVNVSLFNVFHDLNVYPIIILGQLSGQDSYKRLELEKIDDLAKRKFIIPEELKDHKTFDSFNIRIQSGATGFQAQDIKQYLSEINQNSIPFVVSGSVDPYIYSNENVRYMGDKYSSCYINRENDIASSKWHFWENPKIVIAGMTKRIEAVYVENPLGLGVGIYGIYDFGGFDPWTLTLILNSNYLSYYFNIKFKDKHLAGGYLAINKSTISQFPLIDVNVAVSEKLSLLSQEIHRKKGKGLSTEDLEFQADIFVYKLFDIKYNEILKIDPDFHISEKQYTSIAL